MKKRISGYHILLVDSGLYIAVLYLPGTQPITVGKLGTFKFKEGFYFYVGSARQNLAARIERHGKKKKPLRWHIDYLSSRTDMPGAVIINDSRQSECKLARQLSRIFELPAAGFGSSDCRCPGHLFYSKNLP